MSVKEDSMTKRLGEFSIRKKQRSKVLYTDSRRDEDMRSELIRPTRLSRRRGQAFTLGMLRRTFAAS
jgi:hypothetical protein